MKSAIPVLLALALGAPVLADEGHNHEASAEPAPHGGMLRDAPPYKAELVIEGQDAKVYIYEEKADPATHSLKLATLKSKELVGKLRFPKEKKEKTIKFKQSGDFFQARIPGIDKVHRFDLHVALREGEKPVTIDFGVDNIH